MRPCKAADVTVRASKEHESEVPVNGILRCLHVLRLVVLSLQARHVIKPRRTELFTITSQFFLASSTVVVKQCCPLLEYNWVGEGVVSCSS